ncbi:hypothetical protein STSP2_03110 [Anaerohalosphaera lusitana]|uniref:Uncharacterized protein n=1 Tax=Anaerohalosphaera lusitana TaxID=1936003 RepID=A0A1U9NQL5_9BACT|nr:hypothetical protein [Anaerohalosphaera lusitana]AQT69910.1 hypothetical protein STSP2_03110 [Anaerohalosphaera lusitana]
MSSAQQAFSTKNATLTNHHKPLSLTKDQTRAAIWASRLFLSRKKITPQTPKVLHYYALTLDSFQLPDGRPYTNTVSALQTLSASLDYARLLHLLPPNSIIEPSPYLKLIPQHKNPNSASGPYHVEIWAENTSAGYLFSHFAQQNNIPLIASPEIFTHTTYWHFARRAAHIRQPIKIIHLTDISSANSQPTSIVCMKIQQILQSYRLHRFTVNVISLTPDPNPLKLPSCPQNQIGKYQTAHPTLYELEAWHAIAPGAPLNMVRTCMKSLKNVPAGRTSRSHKR